MTISKVYIAGDVGGTKTNLAICRPIQKSPGFKILFKKKYPSQKYKCLSEILKIFIDEAKLDSLKNISACLGVPGPVISGVCETINLPWRLNEKDVAKSSGLKKIHLINDLKATGFGVACLSARNKSLVTIKKSNFLHHMVSDYGISAIVAPGTGLGEAFTVHVDSNHRVFASEGGHVEFSPQDQDDIEFLLWLKERHAHVSYEHVISGPGIYRWYRFYLESKGKKDLEPEFTRSLTKPGADPSALISSRALKGDHELCIQVMKKWCFHLGAEAGNLALKTLSFNGVYLGGGVVPHLTKLLKQKDFLKGFEQKGRMKNLMKKISVYLIKEPETALLGAAKCFLSISR